jgi:putative RNA 2'-phosphotransferase
MNDKRKVTVSKFLSKHLRHAPEELGLELQPGGWVGVDELLLACENHSFPITYDELRVVVETSDKKRFSFDETEDRIRANQGHSVEVDLQLQPANPPSLLYHGTPEKNRQVIQESGLKKMDRHHVHLSLDVETAQKVGKRRGKPIIFVVDSAQMAQDGYVFFVSANGVWLIDEVPPKYLKLLNEKPT